ncbi:alpha/beta fold hydrolase [Streptomyces sp. NPDC059853]|uniref:alpha/beta fold hydrolase n=1 Tax=Streptomyces sp. NPDC059853 TaxID=3346973 RepID=UPI003647ADDF
MSDEVIRSLTVSGVPYSYRLLPRRGPGPVRTEPVLVIGGALQGMGGWQQLETALGPFADVVTTDLPGMGGAGPLPPGPSHGLLGRALEGILDDLGCERVNVFGFSYGAGLAHGLVRRSPHRVARVVLGGVPADISDGLLRAGLEAERLLARGEAEAFAEHIAAMLLCLDERRHVTRRALAYRYVRRALLHTARHSPHLGDSVRRALTERADFSGGPTGVPTLVFSGEHDTVTSPGLQRLFAERIGARHFLTVPDTDHWVVLERARETADLAARFFTDRSPSGAPCLRRVARDPEPVRLGAAAGRS